MADSTVLLIDDNPTFLDIIGTFLSKQAGWQVVAKALEAGTALRLAQQLKPEFVLLDLGMPGLTGLELLPLIRSLLPEAGIVILTLLDTEGYAKAALAGGADAFVSKASLNRDLMSELRRIRAQRGTDAGSADVVLTSPVAGGKPANNARR
jgi:DNA-binding NarL/FixJ family response regulator